MNAITEHTINVVATGDSRIRLELVDPNGKVVETTTSPPTTVGLDKARADVAAHVDVHGALVTFMTLALR